MSDALAIAGSGFSKTSGILTLLETFEEETNKKTNIFVWKEAWSNLAIIIQNWDFENKPVQDGLKKFRTRLVSKCLKKKGYNPKDSDNTVEHMFKALHSSNGGEYPKVMKVANEMFQPFLAGEYIAININVQELVFAIALKHGGTKEVWCILNMPTAY